MSDISTITRNVISQLCAEYDADQKRISRMQEEITKLREQVKKQVEIIKHLSSGEVVFFRPGCQNISYSVLPE